MKLISNIIKRFTKKDIKVLGRWNIERCDKRMNNKVDMSNEDHCGPCGQYILNKDPTTSDNKNTVVDKKNGGAKL